MGDLPFAILHRASRMLPWRSIVLVGLAAALYVFAGPAPEAWVFDRSAIAAGEVHRLLTGHWVHSDMQHALWDIAALALLGVLFERRLRGAMFVALALGTLVVDVWLWWGMPALAQYCGLSGILNSLLAAGGLHLWRQTHAPIVLGVLAAAGTKVLVELFADTALFTNTAWRSVPSAHIAGLAAGVLGAILCCDGSTRWLDGFSAPRRAVRWPRIQSAIGDK